MLKKILLALAVLVVLLLVIAAFRPGDFRVQRSAVIQAPPQRIQRLIDDFHLWDSWSPWEHLDPNMQRTFGGAASGRGATYAWTGNGKVGKGKMEILETSPAGVTIDLWFLQPIEGHNTAEFTFTPVAGGTEVTWAMTGRQPFVGRVMGLFVSMDRMIGKDFESGLAKLKAAAES
jgi:polyketide cyclase/dehydrase/lipid transport protein